MSPSLGDLGRGKVEIVRSHDIQQIASDLVGPTGGSSSRRVVRALELMQCSGPVLEMELSAHPVGRLGTISKVVARIH